MTSEMLQTATYCIIRLGRYQTQPFVSETPFCISTFYVDLKEDTIFYFLPAFHLAGQNCCISSTFLPHCFLWPLLEIPSLKEKGDKAVWRNASTGACNLTQLKSIWMGLCNLLSLYLQTFSNNFFCERFVAREAWIGLQHDDQLMMLTPWAWKYMAATFFKLNQMPNLFLFLQCHKKPQTK